MKNLQTGFSHCSLFFHWKSLPFVSFHPLKISCMKSGTEDSFATLTQHFLFPLLPLVQISNKPWVFISRQKSPCSPETFLLVYFHYFQTVNRRSLYFMIFFSLCLGLRMKSQLGLFDCYGVGLVYFCGRHQLLLMANKVLAFTNK